MEKMRGVGSCGITFIFFHGCKLITYLCGEWGCVGSCQAIDVPGHGFLDPLAYAMTGLVAEQVLHLANVSQRMSHVAGTEVAVDGL